VALCFHSQPDESHSFPMIAWLQKNRSTARLAFVMRVFAMAAGALLSLMWARAFLHLLGRDVYGLLLTFLGVIRLATMGDFGITGALGIRTGQMLGRGEQDRLADFLASARTLFVFMALAISIAFASLSPWLPHWLGFSETPGAGTLTALFSVAGFFILLSFTDGYFQSLNSGCGTVMWPVVPMFLLGQMTLLAQWLVARHGAPLWELVAAQSAVLAVQVVFSYSMLRGAFPKLAHIRPFGFDPAQWRELGTASGWVCLYMLGSFIFTMTDRLLVNAGFGSGAVPAYQFNYKPVEMALTMVLTASFVSQGKINIWIADPAPQSQERARAAVRRLALFQSLAGTACALAYLALDNVFIKAWVGPDFQRPMLLQWAFALTLVVTTAGDAGIQIAGICGRGGLRTAGIAIGLTSLLNLALSFLSMRCHWLAGIAYATVFAQTILSLYLGWRVCSHLKLSWPQWFVRSWLLPVVAVVLLGALQFQVGSDRWMDVGILLGAGGLLFVLQAGFAGVTRDFLRHELEIARGLFQAKK